MFLWRLVLLFFLFFRIEVLRVEGMCVKVFCFINGGRRFGGFCKRNGIIFFIFVVVFVVSVRGFFFFSWNFLFSWRIETFRRLNWKRVRAAGCVGCGGYLDGVIRSGSRE